jgi:hypothetical protein
LKCFEDYSYSMYSYRGSKLVLELVKEEGHCQEAKGR